MARGKSLLPVTTAPEIVKIRVPKPDALDALLVILPESAEKQLFRQLPESERWQELNARAQPRSGTVRTTVLTNRRQTLAVLGYMGADATPFERLALAGRMLKETAGREPQVLGLMALGKAAPGQAALDALLAAALGQAFPLPSFRSQSGDERHIKRIVLHGNDGLDTRYAIAAAQGTNLARWLTALPPNILDTHGYKRAIAELAHRHGLEFKWLDEAALRRAGANAFLAVSAANAQRVAGIAHLRYRPGRRKASSPDIALIGKGILFDTGGVNLKPHRSMLDMHTDMGGSAVALASLVALAQLRAPLAADAWLAITENNIGPSAYRPQEVVRAANGVTIQVIHTDAEGRMVLADTLALAARTQPKLMIDFATLTGAAVYALTERMSCVFTNRPELAGRLVEAGRTSGERVWNFPFDADYDSDLESKIADVVQCAVEGKGDHILATRFLSRFVPKEIPWVHVDLSSATRSGGLGHINTDVTGFGVRYTLELILKQQLLELLED
ncbi:MAG TPA: leucyl aminopeptidase family protein [Steroidobacteraceae bacterium]|nr:leucyl aminopeptidase family protein [Steroidobacteraceae bacterium]